MYKFKALFSNQILAAKLYHYVKGNGNADDRLPNGTKAVTICAIFNKYGVTLSSGYAWCSERDNFNRRIGRRIALGRALTDLYPGQKERVRNIMRDLRV